MTNNKLYELHADVCKALAHSARIEIIDVLNKEELTFGDIAKKTGLGKSNLSQHLTLMVSKGLLFQRKEGLFVYYKLSSRKVYDAFKIMREVLKDKIIKEKSLLKIK